MALLGFWPAGPDKPEFDRWVAKLGRKPNGFRSRGGEGSFNPGDSWLISSSREALASGYRVSLQIAPKTGTGGNRKGILWRDIAAGRHDAFILERFKALSALPVDKRQTFEVHSEANIQDPSPAAQPFSGRPDEYPAFAQKVHDLAVKAGVRDRLRFILSMTRGPWESNEWQVYTRGTDEILDLYAVDGYSMPDTAQAKSFASIIKGCGEAAASKGKRIAVMETGCQEDPKNSRYKADWFDDTGLTIASAGRQIHSVWFNLSNDGPGGWPVDSSAASLAAFKRLITGPAFPVPGP